MAFRGNPNLRRAGVPVNFTKWQEDEWFKCADDPIYFIETYVSIVTLDYGVMPFVMFPFQKKMVTTFDQNRFTICKLPRQVGKSTTTVAYFLWKILFHDSQAIGILANKGSLARDLLEKITFAYERLPNFLQAGVVTWNKGKIELENGCKIIAGSTTSSAVRGNTYNMLLLDEFAFVDRHLAEKFFTSVYPSITAGKNTKIIVVSTPNGMNHFYSMWVKAVEKKSEYVPIEIKWNDVPGRDEKFKAETIANTSEQQWRQEFECVAAGSMVKLRDRETGEIFETTIEDAYNLLAA